MSSRMLVAGIGNVFMGDDAFGVEVVRALARTEQPADVVLMDAGIRGIDLAYALLDGYSAAILIDATCRGRAPGTLYVLDPGTAGPPSGCDALDAHALEPDKVLAFIRSSGVPLRVRVVGCEPKELGTPDEPSVGLSDVVAAAIEPACQLVAEVLEELRALDREVAAAPEEVCRA